MMGLHAGSAAERIMDWFSLYGSGTARNLADELGLDYRLVQRTLHRLRERRMVTARLELRLVRAVRRPATSRCGFEGDVWEQWQHVNLWSANPIVLELMV
jgi:DNA-binding transcriptional ArsR family regulator